MYGSAAWMDTLDGVDAQRLSESPSTDADLESWQIARAGIEPGHCLLTQHAGGAGKGSVMAAAIHVHQRDAARDAEIATARASASRGQVAERFGITADAVTAICSKVRKQKSFELRICRPGEREVPVGTVVTHKGFAEACIGAYRHFGEYFRGLNLPDWYLTDGHTQMKVAAIREELAKRTN